MKTKELIGLIGGMLAIIGVAFGAYFHFENKFFTIAGAEEVKKEVSLISKRLDEKIQGDRFKTVEERIWRVEERMEKRKLTDLEKEELRKLKAEKEDLSKSLKEEKK